mmetsp:Transcript_19730/g.37590  ORF Transcript_19730/g.37590 Transcript_19730/m.37590 type:complete len:920 (-) Transcript_19730:193-2952(-)
MESKGEHVSTEEVEPWLKYSRFGGSSSVPALLAAETASCLCVGEKVLALGTHRGSVHLMDLDGNEVRRLEVHKSRVTALCVDARNEFVGSSSDDGSVAVTGLCSEEQFTYQYGDPVKTLALDPEYAVKKSRSFVSGGVAGNLILNSKGWLGNRDHVLHSGEGGLHAVRWRGSLIAWANDAGVKMYDSAAHVRVAHIPRPPGSPAPDLLRCHLHWASDSTLLIAWADSVMVAKVSGRAAATDAATEHSSGRAVHVVAMFQTNYFLSGIAPFASSLLLLAYHPPGSGDSDSEPEEGHHPPELALVTWKNEALGTDVLKVHGLEHYKANDYSLAFASPPSSTSSSTSGSAAGPVKPSPAGGVPEEAVFYLVSPKDIVVARPRTSRDSVEWLLQHGKYRDALRAARAVTPPDPELVAQAGRECFQNLVDSEQYAAAAALSEQLPWQVADWERAVLMFAELGHLPALAPHLPTSLQAPLKPQLYELALTSFLKPNVGVVGMLQLVRRWPPHLFSAGPVVEAVQRRLVSQLNTPGPDTDALQEVLAELYMADGQRERALGIYLQLQRPGLFTFIEQHGLHAAVRDKVLLLTTLDAQRAISLLVQHRAVVPVAQVVAQLSAESAAESLPDARRVLHDYLALLFQQDPQEGGEWHEMQVELFAAYDRAGLMHFLRSSNSYPLERALAVCKAADPPLVHEMVYLLGRMGSTRKALGIIITQVQDIDAAIEFVQSQQDEELWEELISHSLGSPPMVAALLDRIGRYTDPLSLLTRLPPNMPIPRLRDRLVGIMADYRTQASLRHGCSAILHADCAALSGRLHMEARRAVSLSDVPVAQLHKKANLSKVTRCSICIDPLSAQAKSCVVFFCAHAYHVRCLMASKIPSGPPPFAEDADASGYSGQQSTGDWTCVVCRSARANTGVTLTASR